MITIILVAGVGIIYQNFEWSVFFAFIISLRLFQTSSTQVAGMLTTFSRMYPKVYRYYIFFSDAKNSLNDIIDDNKIPEQISLKVSHILNENKYLVLDPSNDIYLIHPDNIDRNTVALLQKSNLYVNAAKVPYYWFSGNMKLEGMTLRELYGFNHSMNNDSIYRELLDMIQNGEEFENFNLDIDQVLTEDIITKFPENFIDCIRIFSAKYTPRPIILLSYGDLKKYNKILKVDIRKFISNKIIITLLKDIGLIEQTDESSLLLLSSRNELIGWFTKPEYNKDKSLLEVYYTKISEEEKINKSFIDESGDLDILEEDL